MDTIHTAQVAAPVTTATSRLTGALLALALGISIISAVGFLQGPQAAVHNAAHDTRHAFAFPCH